MRAQAALLLHLLPRAACRRGAGCCAHPLLCLPPPLWQWLPLPVTRPRGFAPRMAGSGRELAETTAAAAWTTRKASTAAPCANIAATAPASVRTSAVEPDSTLPSRQPPLRYQMHPLTVRLASHAHHALHFRQHEPRARSVRLAAPIRCRLLVPAGGRTTEVAARARRTGCTAAAVAAAACCHRAVAGPLIAVRAEAGAARTMRVIAVAPVVLAARTAAAAPAAAAAAAAATARVAAAAAGAVAGTAGAFARGVVVRAVAVSRAVRSASASATAEAVAARVLASFAWRPRVPLCVTRPLLRAGSILRLSPARPLSPSLLRLATMTTTTEAACSLTTRWAVVTRA